MGAARIARATLAYGLPLAAIALLAAGRIPLPLHGDQTLFLMGAEVMQRGGVLYADFWDAKQPGIFLFYWLAGRAFGFHAAGIHQFELLWHLILAAGMVALLRPHLRTPALASVAPIAAVGGYYAVAGVWEMTQVEALVGLPLLAFVAALTRASGAPGRRRLAWFASGVAAGVLLLLKLLFAAIPAAGWLVAAYVAHRSHGAPWRNVLREGLAPAALGLALVLGVTAGAFAAAGALGPLLWTSFVYPLESLGSGAANPRRLLDTTGWALRAFWPLAFLALLAPLPWRGLGTERVWLFAAAWGMAGTAVILAQAISWWRYHMLLLLVPAAMLAVRGVDGLVHRTDLRLPARATPVVAVLVALLACVPALRQRSGGPIAPPALASMEERVAWQRQVSPQWDRIWRDTEFLRAPDALPGPIYVFGDPRAIHLAGREQAIAINGWSWEAYPARLWAALPDLLAAAAPAYVGIEPMYEPLIRERAPRVWTWLREHYRPVRTGEERAWHERAPEH